MENQENFDFWLLLAGLGIFLYGMYQLEKGLSGLAGNSLKHILKKFTNRSWKGILTGASFTALLQSSSLVTLLVAAFLSAGLLNFHSAFGVVLGVNLGTTATAWIVAILGFKVNIAQLSFPFLAIGILSYMMLDTRPVLKNIGSFLMGFGLLFLGLDYMKDAIDSYTTSIDIGKFSSYGLWIYVIIGIIITALIQSSSAMVVIVLSALNGGLIDIYHASAVVIGSNVGTTSTLFLASLKGSPDKKRLALGNVIFNMVTGIVGYIFITHILSFIINRLGVDEAIMQLAVFNSLFNLGGILLLYPFINKLIKHLQQTYQKSVSSKLSIYIQEDSHQVPDVAIQVISKELHVVFEKTYLYILSTLKYHDENPNTDSVNSSLLSHVLKKEKHPFYEYELLKNREDELSEFYSKVTSTELTEADAVKLNIQMEKLRSMIYAAKTIKDITFNIEDLDKSMDKSVRNLLKSIQKFSSIMLKEYSDYLDSAEPESLKEQWKEDIEKFYRENIQYIFKEIGTKNGTEVPISTLTNVVKKTTTTLEELYNAFPIKSV